MDTSVIGGCYDDEFMAPSRALMKMARDGKLCLLVSQLLVDELKNAPSRVQRIVVDIPAENVEAIFLDEESHRLRDAYLEAEVV